MFLKLLFQSPALWHHFFCAVSPAVPLGTLVMEHFFNTKQNQKKHIVLLYSPQLSPKVVVSFSSLGPVLFYLSELPQMRLGVKQLMSYRDVKSGKKWILESMKYGLFCRRRWRVGGPKVQSLLGLKTQKRDWKPQVWSGLAVLCRVLCNQKRSFSLVKLFFFKRAFFPPLL